MVATRDQQSASSHVLVRERELQGSTRLARSARLVTAIQPRSARLVTAIQPLLVILCCIVIHVLFELQHHNQATQIHIMKKSKPYTLNSNK